MILFRRLIIFVACLIMIIVFSKCVYVGALIMAIDERATITKWKTGKYKTRIQRRIGWAGPPYYHCKLKIQKLGGLYSRTIVNETFSREDYAACIIKYPFHNDTIAVDVCKKQTTLKK